MKHLVKTFLLLSLIINCATIGVVGNAGLKPFKNQQYLNEVKSISSTEQSLTFYINTSERLENDPLKNDENDLAKGTINRNRCVTVDLKELEKLNIIQIPTEDCKHNTENINSVVYLGQNNGLYVPAMIIINNLIRIESVKQRDPLEYDSFYNTFNYDYNFNIENFPQKNIKSVLGYSGNILIIFDDNSAYGLITEEFDNKRRNLAPIDNIISAVELIKFLNKETCNKPNHCKQNNLLYKEINLLPIDMTYGRIEMTLDISNDKNSLERIYRYSFTKTTNSKDSLIKISIKNRVEYKKTFRPMLYALTPAAIYVDVITLPIQIISIFFVLITEGLKC